MPLAFDKAWSLLSAKEQRQGYLLFAMILVMALLETAGVASIVPFVSVLANPGVIETNPYLLKTYRFLAFHNSADFMFFLGVLVFVMLLISISFQALTTYVLLRFTQMSNYSLSCRMVAGYLRQPYEWFLNQHSADIGKTVLTEVAQVINGALIPMLQLIAKGAVVLSILVLLIIVDPFLAIVTAVGLGGAYVGIYMTMRQYLARIGVDRLEANQKRYRVVQETFGGVKDVKVAGLESAMLASYERPAKCYAEMSAASSMASQLPRYVLELIVFGGLLTMSLYFMADAAGANKALPMIALYTLAGYRLMPAMQQVYAHVSTIRVADAVLDNLYRDMNSLPLERSLKGSVVPLGLTQNLRLDQVTYSYPGMDHVALKKMTLDIQAFTTVGIVGATGSGKTTTVDVILGLLRPQTGSLIVDGRHINEDNIHSWQRTIGYVSQHIYLTDDTIRANIAFGIPANEINNEAVERAARIANVHEFIIGHTPYAYDTHVGERGVRLSGGQRQRIGIARALYHDPTVLILDEATSALDNLTEQCVMDAVRNLVHRKTIILIAHRLSTVRTCDRIFLLEQGGVAAQGTFDELLVGCNVFRAMAGDVVSP